MDSYGAYYDNEEVLQSGVAYWVDPAFLLGLVPALSDSVIHNTALELMDVLGEQVPTEVDILNFTYELREIGDLIPKLEGDIAKDVGGLYLNNQFGWSPMIGDIQKLFTLLETVRKRIAFLRKTKGRRTRIGALKKHLDHPSVAPYVYGWEHDANNRITISLQSIRSDMRATGYLYHELEHLDGLDGELRGMIGALGLNHPIGSIWESLPWSFFIDWFLKIGDRLKRLAVQPFPGYWAVEDPTVSISTAATLKVLRECNPPGTHGVSYAHRQEFVFNAFNYVRFNYFPLNWLDVSEPTTKQLTLMLALSV
jgi:hypothetical protein